MSESQSRYRTIELLAQRERSQTWLATDRIGNEVILKQAEIGTPEEMALRREAEFLRSLNSPTIPKLFEWIGEPTENRVSLVREYRAGQSLAERLQSSALSLDEVIQLAIQLTDALNDLHQSGVIHCDIKPENLILTHSGIFVIDLGFARSRYNSETQGSSSLIGSVRYMAPEQAGVTTAPVSVKSDLFSVGCVIFEALTGQPLFPGETVREVLRRQAEESPARAIREIKNVPAAVKSVLESLLEKDPRVRSESADIASAMWREVRDRLKAGETQFTVRAIHRTSLSEPEFIGRQAELDALNESAQQTTVGHGGLVFLEAESGGGKSRLLSQADFNGAWVLRGQAADQSGARPFQIFENVIEDIIERANADENFKKRLREGLSEIIPAVCDAFPRLTTIIGQAGTLQVVGPEGLAEQRTLGAGSRLLDLLGTPGRPAVLALDDCQWADELSLKLLGYWASQSFEKKCHTMIIAAFRTEEVPVAHFFRSVKTRKHITLRPFSADDVTNLLNSMAGELPARVHEVVTRLAQGNVFMACSVAYGLFETGALRPAGEASGWIVDDQALETAQSSRRAAVFLAQRLNVFPREVRDVLECAAIIGKEFDLQLTHELSKKSVPELIQHLDEACLRRIVWQKTADTFCFAHDKIREALLNGISSESRTALHLAAAEAIERQRHDNCFDLAYHYDAAFEPVRAFPHALAAAQKARARHALRLSIECFEIAVKAIDSISLPQKMAVLEGLGDVYMLAGRYEAARADFDRAKELSGDPLFLAGLESKTAELLFKQGDVQAAQVSAERALRALGRKVPSGDFAVIVAMIWEILVQATHTIFGSPRARRAPSAREKLTLNLYSRLAYIYWFGKGMFACLWTHLKEVNMAERFEESLELAQAYSEHAPVMSQLPWFSRGLAYGNRSLEIRRRFGDIWGEAQSLNFLGIICYSGSQFKEAIEKLTVALSLFERTGDRWEANTASWHIAYAHYRLGHLCEAVEIARSTVSAGNLIGDHHAVGISLSAWAKASQGDVPEDLLAVELKRRVGDGHTRVEILTAEGLRLLRAKNWSLAVARFREAVSVIKKFRLRQEYVAPTRVWLVTALRMQAESLSLHEVGDRDHLLREALRECRQAIALARFFRNNLPHALREKALLFSFLGKRHAALRLLEKSVDIAHQQNARHEEAQSLAILASLKADTAIEARAKRLMLETEEPMRQLLAQDSIHRPEETPSLLDRFSSLLESGRKIASSLDTPSVFREIKESADRLLRAPLCFTLSLQDGVPVDSPHRVSRKLLETCLRLARPVSLDELLTQNPTDSLILMERGSALYAPIFVDGEPAAVLCAVHLEAISYFGDEEKHLADFISTLAGAALKNALRVAETKKALDARDQFLSLASHELKTPLTSLKLQGQLLTRIREKPELDLSFEKFMPIFDRQLMRLNRLVEDLLDVSRLSSGRFQLQDDLEDLDLAQVARDVATELALEMRQGGCTISFESEGDVTVKGDRLRLTQVLSNLLTNARRYAPGKIEVRVSRRGRDAFVEINDHGPGIEKSYQAKIFERFEQAPQKHSSGGLGLGLYISREIVRSHQGEMGVVSEPGKGSRFWIQIPLSSEVSRRGKSAPS